MIKQLHNVIVKPTASEGAYKQKIMNFGYWIALYIHEL